MDEIQESVEVAPIEQKKNMVVPAILIGAVIVGASIIAAAYLLSGGSVKKPLSRTAKIDQEVELPVRWGDLGKQLTDSGVVDKAAFEALYNARGGITEDMGAMLSGSDNGNIRLTPENSGAVLNLLWALGLGNKNVILTEGEMMSPSYGGAGGFASTGGWTLGKGDAMSHYAMHNFLDLDAEAQAKTERTTKNIFRPCCGNSTHFPDCNHGMAMLGLMQLMASQGASEEEMYKAALQANIYWFPDQYGVIGQYLASEGTTWDKVDPKVILGENYSSGSGYKAVAAAVEALQNPTGAPAPRSSGGGCGV